VRPSRRALDRRRVQHLEGVAAVVGLGRNADASALAGADHLGLHPHHRRRARRRQRVGHGRVPGQLRVDTGTSGVTSSAPAAALVAGEEAVILTPEAPQDAPQGDAAYNGTDVPGVAASPASAGTADWFTMMHDDVW
jgi:hypothetical protein